MIKMETLVKISLLLFVVVLVIVGVTVYLAGGIPSPPESEYEWTEEADIYADDYLLCLQKKSGMPMAYVPDAVVLVICSSEKLANMTDNIVDLLDLRACQSTYMIDEGYFLGTYMDACVEITKWENDCDVPYEMDCSEVVAFIEANHDLIADAIEECS